MASNVDCKQNEATCSKKQPYVETHLHEALDIF